MSFPFFHLEIVSGYLLNKPLRSNYEVGCSCHAKKKYYDADDCLQQVGKYVVASGMSEGRQSPLSPTVPLYHKV